MNNYLFRFFKSDARLFFLLTILLMPFRLQLVLWSRPFLPVYSGYTDFLLSASDFALLFTLGFWSCSLILEPRNIKSGNKFVAVILGGLTLAAWVSTFGSVDPTVSRYQAFRFVLLFFFYLYVINEIETEKWVLVPVVLQALIQTPIALGQSLAQSSLGLQFLGEHKLDPMVLGTSIIPVNGERFLRAYGLADHPNILGGCLAFTLILLLAVVLYGKRRELLVSAICFLIILPALLLTFSRSAWLCLFVGAAFLVGFELLNKRWDAILRIFFLGVVCTGVVFPLLAKDTAIFAKRFNGGNVSEDGPMFERAFLLNAGNTLFVEHPAIGVGLGASALAMKLRFEYFPLNFQPPHYTPLTVALETGVVGGVFYLLLFLMPLADFLYRRQTYIQNPAAMGVFALLLGITVVNLFDYYTWGYTPGRIWQWLAWGLYSVVSSRAA